jgi:hypothetical protein
MIKFTDATSLSIIGLIATLRINDIRHSNTQHNNLVSYAEDIVLSVAFLNC